MHSQFNHVYIEDDFTHHDDALTCVSGGASAVQRCALYGDSTDMHVSCMCAVVNTCVSRCDLLHITM